MFSYLVTVQLLIERPNDYGDILFTERDNVRVESVFDEQRKLLSNRTL
jgi:hypothetical protein